MPTRQYSMKLITWEDLGKNMLTPELTQPTEYPPSVSQAPSLVTATLQR